MDVARILVVDDEKEICEVTKSFLSKRNYSVSTASSEDEAIGLLKKEHPHLVLLDVRLGSVSGMDTLRKIKEIDRECKVIMVTGLDEEESIRQAKALGADDYITKPFTASYLNDLVLQKIALLCLKEPKHQP